MKTAVVLLLLLTVFPLQAQQVIRLKNASFELDSSHIGRTPAFWIDRGFEFESPVDIQPGIWNVQVVAVDGNRFVGMATRGNYTWESIGQILDQALLKDSTYEISLWLTRSEIYLSPDFHTAAAATSGYVENVNFSAPTMLKIFGRNTKTEQIELLGESDPVSSEHWARYVFKLRPTQGSYDEIDFMAYYAPGYENQNGNLLIDGISDIVRISK